MKKSFHPFRSSAAELKDVRCLSVTGLLIGIYAVLEFISVIPNFSLKINFGFLAVAAIGMLYGPVVGMLGAGICDLVGLLVRNSGAPNPIFTAIAVAQGLIYGLIAYHRLNNRTGKARDVENIVRMVVARLLDVAIINVTFNTFAVYFLTSYGASSSRTFAAYWWLKFVKNVVELPADIVLLVLITPVLYRIYEGVFGRRKNIV